MFGFFKGFKAKNGNPAVREAVQEHVDGFKLGTTTWVRSDLPKSRKGKAGKRGTITSDKLDKYPLHYDSLGHTAEKICERCGVLKPLDEYYRRDGGKFRRECKSCYKKAWAKKAGAR